MRHKNEDVHVQTSIVQPFHLKDIIYLIILDYLEEFFFYPDELYIMEKY